MHCTLCVCIITYAACSCKVVSQARFCPRMEGFTIVDGDVRLIDHSEEPGAALKSRLLTARSRGQEQVSRGCGNQRGQKAWRVAPPRWCTTTGQLSADFGSRQRSGSLNFAARGGVAHQRGCIPKEKKVQLLGRPKIGCCLKR